MNRMHKNKSVNTHQFTMVPAAEIPRSTFDCQSTHKTTFNAGYLVPVYVDEVLPGDTFNLKMTAFTRMATPIYPIMDNLYIDSFFFFVPNRLLWDNWQKFMGEQRNPGDSTSFVVPVLDYGSAQGGFPIGSVYDYMGLPTVGQYNPDETMPDISALHLRAYNLIYNEWFRDENLQDSVATNTDDGPDPIEDYNLLLRGKRKDYFTSALPWPQKGASVSLPLGTSATVYGNGKTLGLTDGSATLYGLTASGAAMGLGDQAYNQNVGTAHTGFDFPNKRLGVVEKDTGVESGLYADLSTATAATINQLRQSFQIQKLLERDARGGTRYTEILRAHFGVASPDARLQRPEYLGGGSTPMYINPVVQTSASDVSGSTTPLGELSATGTALTRNHGFTQSFVEHGVIIGLVSVRADLTYQQGLHRMWSRSTRYDFYFPAFAMLGEQAVLTKEIYCADPTSDETVFGYQERWAEYRYNPSRISGLFRSTAANTLDGWHLAQKFIEPPVLNDAFISENPPMGRILAVAEAPYASHFIFDSFFDVRKARPLPMYSVPGLIDHF